MKLQILIPQYKETEEVIKPMLDSLMTQQAVDFSELGVIIVNDGTDVELSQEFLSSYPYKIEYYKAPHRGVSATRNTCLDYAIADYVMFCDADDMFCNVLGLYMIFNEIAKGFDSLSSLFVEEVKTAEGTSVFINHEHDGIFVHGKIHRRQYLIDKGIRWNPNLTIHEDSFFNIQCQALAAPHKYLGQAFYLWRYRPDSVCRSDEKYLLKTYPNLVDSVDGLVEAMDKNNRSDLTRYYVAHLVFDAYYSLNEPKWRDDANLEYLTRAEKRIGDFLKKYQKHWESCPEDTKRNISQECRANSLKRGMLMEKLTLDQWLDKLSKM